MRVAIHGLMLLALLLAPAHAALQAGAPQVTAQLESGIVRFGSTVKCLVSVEGVMEAELLELPSVDGLAVERAVPSVSTHVDMRYGRRRLSKTYAWQLVLRPQRVGEFEIPPIPLRVDGERMSTRALTLSVVEDMQGRELGHVELVDPPSVVYEGEPFTIDILLGWDRALGEGVNYLNLILPWWGELPGTLEIPSGDVRRGADRLTTYLNYRQQVTLERAGTKQIGDKTFELFRLRRTYVATRPGTLQFPQSHLEFGRLTEGGFRREPTKKTYYTPLDAFELEVRPLPEEGRPFDFSGAVGKVAATAQADQRDVDAGDSIKLSVDWTGRANLEFFQPPELGRLDAFDGFRVYGSTDRFRGDRRTVVYDVAPLAPEVKEIPGVPLVIFDPELERYRTVTTPPIPIRVRPLEGESGLELEGAPGSGPVLDLRDIQVGRGEARRGPDRGPGGGVVLGAMAALPLLWLGLRTAVRRRGDPDSAEARRRRGARRRLERELRSARGAEQQALALHRFLAARTSEPDEAWEGREPLEWARESDGRVGTGDARALAELVRALEERRWAGGDQPLEPQRILEVADRLVKGGL